MKKTLLLAIFGLMSVNFRPTWGFFAHDRINRLAVFTLPPDMIGFYKKNIDYLGRTAVNPDKRRYVIEEEAPRHFIDLDHYGDSAMLCLPRQWNQAVDQYGLDTLMSYGILPWHIYEMHYRLTEAFLIRDPALILKVSAELGHYISDANVPLHTTENYNGQLTGQAGIHGFWESRLPEAFSQRYDFFVGRAEYVPDIRATTWRAIECAHEMVATVLAEEKKLGNRYQEKKYAFETRNKATVKVYSLEYADEYHTLLRGMVEKQMRVSIKMTGDFWFTAWVNAGQPDLKRLMDYKPTDEEIAANRKAVASWKVRHEEE